MGSGLRIGGKSGFRNRNRVPDPATPRTYPALADSGTPPLTLTNYIRMV